MSIKDLRTKLGDTQAEFSKRYNIPFRTIQNWEAGINTPPAYVEDMLKEKVNADLINRRQCHLPEWKNAKEVLPKSTEFRTGVEWLLAVKEVLGEDVVFALDSALLCDGSYLGRTNEWIVWIYGPAKLMKYKGVCVIGDNINPFDVEEKNGLKYTCFNRTINDAMANERILDMQGITEALSRYYFSNNETFEGLHPNPEYTDLFNKIAEDAAEYYDD